MIACIFFDGVASRQEPDEYVEIVNMGETDRDLNGWRLVDVSDDGPTFTFPEIVIMAGRRVRVYTNEVHEAWGGLSFGRGSAIWSNSEPDTAGTLRRSGNAGLYEDLSAGVSVKGYTRPFAVSLSNRERPFDKLRANGTGSRGTSGKHSMGPHITCSPKGGDGCLRNNTLLPTRLLEHG